MKTIVFAIVISLSLAWNGTVEADEAGPTLEEWQLGLIYEPSDAMLEREARGFVFIYDGLSDSAVDQILDDQYDRMEYMMFTRIKKIDPDGDEMLVDDGCD